LKKKNVHGNAEVLRLRALSSKSNGGYQALQVAFVKGKEKMKTSFLHAVIG
jgi:hypothetical protein